MREMFGKKLYDSLREIVNPRHTAVIVVDMQNDFCSPEGHYAKHGRDTSMVLKIVSNLTRFLNKARKSGVKIVFIQNTNLPQGHSDSPSWLRYKCKGYVGAPEYTIEGTWGHEFYAGLEPRDGELIIKKHRPSAFFATDLNLLLRNDGIESTVITGCVTQGCVMGTALHAAYYDYYVVIPRDLVGSYDPGLHEAALNIMDGRLDISSSEEILKEWSSV